MLCTKYVYRIKMLPSVKYDGTPKYDRMCSKPHSQSVGPQYKEIKAKTYQFTLFLINSNIIKS